MELYLRFEEVVFLQKGCVEVVLNFLYGIWLLWFHNPYVKIKRLSLSLGG